MNRRNELHRDVNINNYVKSHKQNKNRVGGKVREKIYGENLKKNPRSVKGTLFLASLRGKKFENFF